MWGGASRFGFLPVGAGEVYWYAAWTAPAGEAAEPVELLDRLRTRYRAFPAPVPDLLAATRPADTVALTRRRLASLLTPTA